MKTRVNTEHIVYRDMMSGNWTEVIVLCFRLSLCQFVIELIVFSFDEVIVQ
jgi:hypothetical protein